MVAFAPLQLVSCWLNVVKSLYLIKIWYELTGDPLLLKGAVQLTTTSLTTRVVVGGAGYEGTVAQRIVIVADGVLKPITFLAW